MWHQELGVQFGKRQDKDKAPVPPATARQANHGTKKAAEQTHECNELEKMREYKGLKAPCLESQYWGVPDEADRLKNILSQSEIQGVEEALLRRVKEQDLSQELTELMKSPHSITDCFRVHQTNKEEEVKGGEAKLCFTISLKTTNLRLAIAKMTVAPRQLLLIRWNSANAQFNDVDNYQEWGSDKFDADIMYYSRRGSALKAIPINDKLSRLDARDWQALAKLNSLTDEEWVELGRLLRKEQAEATGRKR